MRVKNLSVVPHGYTVQPDARFNPRCDPFGLIGVLGERASAGRPDDCRSSSMAAEIADELLGGSSMYTPHQVPSRSAADQMIEYAWNRTFTERLDEWAQRYDDVSREVIQHDLITAWYNIEQIITHYDDTVS